MNVKVLFSDGSYTQLFDVHSVEFLDEFVVIAYSAGKKRDRYAIHSVLGVLEEYK